MTQETLSLIAIAVSLLALITSVFGTIIAVRSFRQSGAIIQMKLLEKPKLDDAFLLMALVRIYNRGKAPIDVQSLVITEPYEKLQLLIYTPKAKTRRIDGYSHRDYMILFDVSALSYMWVPWWKDPLARLNRLTCTGHFGNGTTSKVRITTRSRFSTMTTEKFEELAHQRRLMRVKELGREKTESYDNIRQITEVPALKEEQSA